MANYRYKAAEIEAMKASILTHIANETETKTAWRLRLAIEGQLTCCRPGKRDTAKLERRLALYRRLTKNDLPDWQAEPTTPAQAAETPRISTETAEPVNVQPRAKNDGKTTPYDRNEVVAYLDESHGVEYDAGDVIYLVDGYVAEDHGGTWHVYVSEESDKRAETIRIAPQSPDMPQMAGYVTYTGATSETVPKRLIGSYSRTCSIGRPRRIY